MSLSIVTFDEDRGAWDAALASMPSRQRDVYFSSAYLLLWQGNGDGRAMGAIFDHGDSVILYPFLLRDLEQVPYLGAKYNGLHDIQTPYGYGGPLINREAGDEHAVQLFRRAFAAWCRENGVVSEFIRFHPLLDTQLGMERHLEVANVNTTVWCRIDCSPSEHLQNLAGSTRRGVRKARESGLTVQVETDDEAYARFVELYRATMERRNAVDYYLFDEDYFRSFRELLGPAQSLLTARYDGKIVAGALFLRSPQFIHYHLGGSDTQALSLRPNNLLFFEAMNWAAGLGIAELHLGGGYRAGGEDELFRFLVAVIDVHVFHQRSVQVVVMQLIEPHHAGAEPEVAVERPEVVVDIVHEAPVDCDRDVAPVKRGLHTGAVVSRIHVEHVFLHFRVQLRPERGVEFIDLSEERREDFFSVFPVRHRPVQRICGLVQLHGLSIAERDARRPVPDGNILNAVVPRGRFR